MSLEVAARVRLKLTTREWICLNILLSREGISHDGLCVVVYGDNPPAQPKCNLSQLVNKVRGKIHPFGCKIDTVYDFGYAMPADSKRRLIAALQAWAK